MPRIQYTYTATLFLLSHLLGVCSVQSLNLAYTRILPAGLNFAVAYRVCTVDALFLVYKPLVSLRLSTLVYMLIINSWVDVKIAS